MRVLCLIFAALLSTTYGKNVNAVISELPVGDPNCLPNAQLQYTIPIGQRDAFISVLNLPCGRQGLSSRFNDITVVDAGVVGISEGTYSNPNAKVVFARTVVTSEATVNIKSCCIG